MKILLFFNFNIIIQQDLNNYFYNLVIISIIHKVILIIYLYIILQSNNDQLFRIQIYHFHLLLIILINKT